ncbi:hypothetical protein, partial [Tangfeifania diversioriginum]|uniref:hypothetical protein n=1 Tax=Tangfeifania diversioriginum TaxID=1168035 RepID=UPI001FE726F5
IQLITFLCRKQKNTIESWINNYSCGNQDKQNLFERTGQNSQGPKKEGRNISFRSFAGIQSFV